MQKNYYMTKSEQSVYNAIKSAEILSSEDIKEMVPEMSGSMLRKTLSSLERKGYLYRIKRGLYLVKPPDSGLILENPYRIALRIYEGYIAFSSALRLYGLMEYEPFTIFVATENRSGRTEIGEYLIKAVSMGKRATGMRIHDGVYTSTLEKTFFDCFYRPQYCGGYEGVCRALYEAGKMDWDIFLSYFERFASPSLCQRTGYVLETLYEAGYLDIPEHVIGALRKRVKNRTRLLPSAPSRGKFDGRWMLLDNLGKERMLGWSDGH